MPWKAKGNEIIRSDTGKVVGHSKSHAMAEASVRARYANTQDSDPAMKYVKKPAMHATGKKCSGSKMCSK